MNQTKLLFPPVFISLEGTTPLGPIEPNPNAAPAEEPVAAEPGLSESDWTLASTETVTHEYLTQNGKVARETIKTNDSLTAVLDFIYDESGKPFALKYSTNGTNFQTYYYVLNLQGDVVKLIQSNGYVAAQYTYDAWGNILDSGGDLAAVNPLRYRGYYYDNETGFYYLQSRYYDPVNRRFINADGLISSNWSFSGLNMFAYCENDPVGRSDPSGIEKRGKGFFYFLGKAIRSISEN